MPLEITRAQTDDIERYLAFLELVAEWLSARGIEQWTPGNFWLSRDYYADSIQKGEVYLARESDQIIGTLRVLLSEPLVWHDVAADDGIYIYNLAVNRAQSGRNLGAYFLNWAGEYARAINRRYVRLDCVAGNAFLREYYMRHGFAERGEIGVTYPQPIGHMRLWRFERLVSDVSA